jgi:hypothetical protein
MFFYVNLPCLSILVYFFYFLSVPSCIYFFTFLRNDVGNALLDRSPEREMLFTGISLDAVASLAF